MKLLKKNVEQGIYYLNKAVNIEMNMHSIIWVKCTFLGKDVEKDKERAIELLTLAAEKWK